MPIFNVDDDDELVIPTEPVEETTEEDVVEEHTYVTQEELQTSTLFNKDVPLDTITANISGMDWEVSYFLQLRGVNEEPQLPDINVSATVLKYNRVSKLIIKLQDAIDQTNPEEITGTAIVNAGFIPNYGDPFIATLTGGREAVFVVTEIKKNTYNLHNTFNIVFKLHVFLDRESVFYNDLVFKTMSEYVYDKNYLADFSAPIILRAEYHEKIELRKVPNQLLEYFMTYMVNEENRVIAIPTDSSIYIDTLLNTFLYKIINHDDHSGLMKLNKISLILESKDSVWDVLLKRDISLLKRVDRDLGFKYTPASISNPNARHASYLGIKFITDKTEIQLIVNYLLNEDAGTHTAPIVPGSTYIFSEAFYLQDTVNATEFENLVLQYLRGEIIDSDILDKYVREYYLWPREQQFYLIPILILLVKNALSTTYSNL